FGARITTRRAPLEFRGIRLGTVSKVPFFASNMRQVFNDDYRIPVLVRIEPERLKAQLGENADVGAHLTELLKRGLRARTELLKRGLRARFTRFA
ncbi:Paraquat-inducible protein B, partial [Salmonella enterica subsp. enterica serovar Mississippi str. A4-633]